MTTPIPDPTFAPDGLTEGQPTVSDPLAMDALFDIEMPPPVSLRDRFGVPPFSVLDRRGGPWQERKRKWLEVGIRSELGRDARTYNSPSEYQAAYAAAKADTTKAAAPRPGGGGGGFWLGKTADGRTRPGDPSKYGGRATETGVLYKGASGRDPQYYAKKTRVEEELGRTLTNEEFEADHYYDGDVADAYATGTSIFDPVLCELVYRWFVGTDCTVLDPFAGGSVRGIAAAMLGRRYTGIDLRDEQIVANRAQVDLLKDDMPVPTWITGDSLGLADLVWGEEFDLVFSCPPYADLEVYSDDPRDLSTMTYPDFTATHDAIIATACDQLRDNRFAAWVISDVRDQKTPGAPYHGLVADTVRAFEKCGLRLYNDAVILDNVGSGAMRAAKNFQRSRKLVRMHQHLLVFVKGDPVAATAAAGGDL